MPNASEMPSNEFVNLALESFLRRTDWRGLSAEDTVREFVRFLSSEIEHEANGRSPRERAKSDLLAAGFTETLIEEPSEMPRQITPEMGSNLLGLHYKMGDMQGLCPGVFWCHDEAGESFTVLDNRGDSFRIDKFASGLDCMAYLDGLSPNSGWGERYGIEDLDAKVNQLAEKAVCPVLPDPELSEWDMHRYGYERGGMLPVGAERAEILFGKVPLHRLHSDGLSTPLQNSWEIDLHADEDGLFGVTTVNWMMHLADSGVVRVEDTPLWQALYGPDEPASERHVSSRDEQPLNVLVKEAKDSAAEKNSNRKSPLRHGDPKGLDR